MGFIEAPAGLGYPRVKYRKIIIPTADVLTLNASPYRLTPDPGSGHVDLLHMIYIKKPTGTAYALSGNGELQVKWRTGNTITQFDASDFAAGGTIRRYAAAWSGNSGNADHTPTVNRGITLSLSGSNEFTAGNSDFEVHIYYQTLDENA